MSSTSGSRRAEVYNTDRFAELYYVSMNPDVDSLALATRYLIKLFRDRHVPYAVLGGWAVYLRGGQRTTQDVDIAVRSTMNDLKATLLRQARYALL